MKTADEERNAEGRSSGAPAGAGGVGALLKGPEAKVNRQFRLSVAEDELLSQLQTHRGDRNIIDTQRWLISLVPGLLAGEYGIDPNRDPTDQVRLHQIADQWQGVADALDVAATAWRGVSPESAGPIAELRAEAQWNLIYWRARGRGLDDGESRREALRVLGDLPSRHITYDLADEEPVSQ